MITWLRRNLFRSFWDSILTVLFAVLAIYVIVNLLRFIFITGRWEIIQVNLKLLLVGRFPEDQMWLVQASVVALAFWIAAVASGVVRKSEEAISLKSRIWDNVRRFGLLALLGLVLIALSGGWGAIVFGLLIVAGIVVGNFVGRARRSVTAIARIPWLLWQFVLILIPLSLIALTLRSATLEVWGGFLINFYIAVISIALSYPLGILLALGRRSSLPVVRYLSTFYIEFLRGSPLFVLLLLAGVALEFFVPPGVGPDSVTRAITVFTLFTAAYVAEIVRGGLQSIPKGQQEAGTALGLSPTKVTFLITLPQALRNVIPAQIGQFISLFKDTTLAGVALNIFEVLNVGTAITKQDDFLGQGLIYESLAFIALLFWVGSYVMSRESQRVEKRLGVGVR